MSRQSRLDAFGALHHVIARGIARRSVFLGPADYEDFLRRLGAVTEWGKWTVLAWALIPDHLHLVVRTGPVPLASVMRRPMTGYAVACNRRHQHHGHLFQNRYQSILCEEEEYPLELVRYVGHNPLRAGLVQDVEELERRVAQAAGLEEGEIRTAGRRRAVVPARRAFSQVAVRRLGYAGAEMARCLGVTTSCVNRAAGKSQWENVAKSVFESASPS